MKKYCQTVKPKLAQIKDFKGSLTYINLIRTQNDYLIGEGFNSFKEAIINSNTSLEYEKKEKMTQEEHKVYSEAIDSYNANIAKLRSNYITQLNDSNNELVRLMNKYYR